MVDLAFLRNECYEMNEHLSLKPIVIKLLSFFIFLVC